MALFSFIFFLASHIWSLTTKVKCVTAYNEGNFFIKSALNGSNAVTHNVSCRFSAAKTHAAIAGLKQIARKCLGAVAKKLDGSPFGQRRDCSFRRAGD